MGVGGRIDLLEPHPEFGLRDTALPVAGDLCRVHENGEKTQDDDTQLQRGPNMSGKTLGLEFQGIFDRTDRYAVHAPITFRVSNTFLARHG